MAWSREDAPDLAAGKILDAAEKAFVEFGVSGASMARVAEAAGCSRGTLYRYFPTRHDLHLGYVDREARRIVERVRDRTADVADPGERLVEAVIESVREVRRNPATAAWFEDGASGVAARMSRSSEVVAQLTGAFTAGLVGDGAGARERRLRGRWLVRVILSLLTLPGESEAEERELVERFALPGLLAR